MKTKHELTDEIETTISCIKKNYPELIKYLDEMPITIPNNGKPIINSNILNNYLLSLKDLIDKYESNHPKK